MRKAFCSAVIGAALLAPRAAAADPVPPDTHWNDHGPNVPAWQTWEIFGSAGSSPVDHIECRVDTGPWVTCMSPWQPGLTGGDHTIAARSVDSTGLADPTPATATVFVDTYGPSVAVELNAGAGTTGRAVVALDLAISDRTGVGEILISNSPELDGDGLLAHAADAWVVGPPTWPLTGHGGNDDPGLHTVYVQAQDAFGNWSEPASDSIVLDPSVNSTVSVRLAASQNPAPIGGQIYLFGVAHPDDGAGITDGDLEIYIENGSHLGSAEGWPIEHGVWVDLSGTPAGTYDIVARYSRSEELEDAETRLKLRVGPALSLLGPQAYFSSPTPPHDPYDPAPFTLPVYSRFHSATAFECRIDGGAWAACDEGLAVPVLADGWHVAEVRGLDAADRVQAVPETFVWFIRPNGGDFHVSPVGGHSGDAEVFISFSPPAGALALRVSNARHVDEQGRLIHAEDWEPIGVGIPTAWNLTDPETGGTSGDGNKIVAVQWQLADGSWSMPGLRVVRLDRSAPDISIEVERGSAFVDEDELLVVVETSERASIEVGTDPDGLHPGGSPGDGLGFFALPATDVPPGTVVVRDIYARARDEAGNLSAIAHGTITIDRSSPVAASPKVTFVVGSTVSRASVDVLIAATATDTGSGVAKVVLQRSQGGSWVGVDTAHAASVKAKRSLSTSNSGAFRARGTDRIGHVGGWSATPELLPDLRSDAHVGIDYTGAWRVISSSSALGNSMHRTSKPGATAEFQFSGRAIGLVAPRGPAYGNVEIVVDGVRVATVDLRRSTARPRSLVFAKTWTSAGSHSIVVRNLDAGGRPVAVDGFVYLP